MHLHANAMRQLEFAKVKERLLDCAMSYLGKRHIEELTPHTDVRTIANLLAEVEEALLIIVHGASVPLPTLDGIETIMSKFGKGYTFTEAEFGQLARLLENTEQLKRFMVKKESVAPRVCAYAASLFDLDELSVEIGRCIRNGRVADEASPELGRLRKKIGVVDGRIRKKLDSSLGRYKAYLQDALISMRGDRYVLSVKREYRKNVTGSVLDESSSGQTVFIEPLDVAELHRELSELRMEESREETKVLCDLTDLAERYGHELSVNLETIGHYDFLFAKAKYARAIGARNVEMGEDGVIAIREGRHPLLPAGSMPLDFRIGGDYSALIITGPNTGGKTVSLKTVGLLTLMAQAGLLVPVGEGSRLSAYSAVLVDIGDGQSIEQSLSTFSAHIKNVVGILREAGPRTLILLDELATGTDPGEGIGLSIAVLEELHRRGSTVVATTHYNEIKQFAAATPGFRNARMEFDTETLQPLYRLTIGEAGSSYAFYIALKLGIDPAIVERSKQIAERAQSRGDGGIAAAADGETPQAHAQAKAPAPTPHSPEPQRRHARKAEFERGDCVWIRSLKRTGIVCGPPDDRGNYTLQIQKEKVKINRKRLSLYVSRDELYPGGDYDMDIVFESVDVRKKRKMMSKGHVPGLTIIQEQDAD